MLSISRDTFFSLVGFIGFVFYMMSYAMLQFDKIDGHGYGYTTLNLVAATLVLISLVHQFNFASVLIQLAWIVLSALGLFRIWYAQRRTKVIRRMPSSIYRL